MTRRYRRYRRNSSDDNDDNIVSGIIVPLFGFNALFLLAQYFTNRTNFWRWIAYDLIGIATIFVIAAGFVKWNEARKQRHLEKLLASVQKAGVESAVKDYIVRWGMGQERSKDAWEHRGYKIDNSRLRDLRDILEKQGLKLEEADFDTLLCFYIEERERSISEGSFQTKIGKFQFIDLNGSTFETLLLRLYEKMGYTVQHSGKTGDQGGDLVAMKGGERLLIQAKCYKNMSVGNDAVQQAFAAKTFYDCNRAAVVTTSEFTREAVELSRTNNVDLISKARLQQLLLDYLQESWN